MIQNLTQKASTGSRLANDLLNRLNASYSAVPRGHSIMTQVKVTRRGPPGMQLNQQNAKAMLQQAFDQLKELYEAIQVGKSLAR